MEKKQGKVFSSMQVGAKDKPGVMDWRSSGKYGGKTDKGRDQSRVSLRMDSRRSGKDGGKTGKEWDRSKSGTSLKMMDADIPADDKASKKGQSKSSSDDSSLSVIHVRSAERLKNVDMKKFLNTSYTKHSRMRFPNEKVWLELQPSSTMLRRSSTTQGEETKISKWAKTRKTYVDIGNTEQVASDSLTTLSSSLETVPSSEANAYVKRHISIDDLSDLPEKSDVGVENAATPLDNLARRNTRGEHNVPDPIAKIQSKEIKDERTGSDMSHDASTSSVVKNTLFGPPGTGVEGTSSQNVAISRSNLQVGTSKLVTPVGTTIQVDGIQEKELIDISTPVVSTSSDITVGMKAMSLQTVASSFRGPSSYRTPSNADIDLSTTAMLEYQGSQQVYGSKADFDVAKSSMTGEGVSATSLANLIEAESLHQYRNLDNVAKLPERTEDHGMELVSSAPQSVGSRPRIDTTDLDLEQTLLENTVEEISEKSTANQLLRTIECESLNTVELRESDEKSTDELKVKVGIGGDLDEFVFLDSTLDVLGAKALLSQHLSVDLINIYLEGDGRVLDDSELICGPRDISVEIRTGIETQSQTAKEESKATKVKVFLEDGKRKYMDVSLDQFASRKRHIGGYRDKRTGQIYYHRTCQTDPRHRTKDSATREAQANLPLVDVSVNTSQAVTTQTCRNLSLPKDKILIPRPYVPHNQVVKTMMPHRAAQIIQNAWRKYISYKWILGHFKELEASLQAQADLKSYASKIVHKRRYLKMTAAIFPSYRSHFSDTLAIVSNWAKTAVRHLADTKISFARKAALSQMLDVEQQMLYCIEKQRLKAVEENLHKQDIMCLEGMARGRATVYDKGNVTVVEDLNTQKANVFKEILASYLRTDTSRTERLEVLNCLRDNLLQEFSITNDTVSDLVDILDREIHLITIGFPIAQLVYLRKRFETKFLHLTKDPEVNPQAKYFRKSHFTPKKYAIRRCEFCNKNLTSSLMFKDVGIRRFKICMSCVQLVQNGATNQLNLTPYQRMLQVMRTKELEKNCRSSIPFLIQPLGVYFLVNVIWNGKSILSGNTDVTQLAMTRWLPDQDWSVWNMILLTEKEASEHDILPNPMDHYPADFILQVRSRNILGRMHFCYLVDIDNDFKFGRTPGGTLPSDHQLYTNKYNEQFIPSNPVPRFFKQKTNKAS